MTKKKKQQVVVRLTRCPLCKTKTMTAPEAFPLGRWVILQTCTKCKKRFEPRTEEV